MKGVWYVLLLILIEDGNWEHAVNLEPNVVSAMLRLLCLWLIWHSFDTHFRICCYDKKQRSWSEWHIFRIKVVLCCCEINPIWHLISPHITVSEALALTLWMCLSQIHCVRQLHHLPELAALQSDLLRVSQLVSGSTPQTIAQMLQKIPAGK